MRKLDKSVSFNIKLLLIGFVVLASVIFITFKQLYEAIIFALALFIVIISLCLFFYYKDSLSNFLNMELMSDSYLTYQGFALIILALGSCSLSLLLISTTLSETSIFIDVLASLVCALPFLGVGLRFRTFHDDSKYVGDSFETGYRPFSYFYVAVLICFIGYGSLFYDNSLINSVVVFLVTTICYLWVIFPDKLNNVLPFDNRTKLGFVIYVGFILVFFVVCAKFLISPDFLLFLSDR